MKKQPLNIAPVGEELSAEELRLASGGRDPDGKTAAASYLDGVCTEDRNKYDTPILD